MARVSSISKVSARFSEQATRPRGIFDALFLAAPPVAAVINVAWGSYAAALVVFWVGLRHFLRRGRIVRLDVAIILAALIVWLSPTWAETTVEYPQSYSASLGAALGVCYALAIRWGIQSKRDFELFATAISTASALLAAFVLIFGERTSVAEGAERFFIEFANANYVSAVMATGATIAFWFARFSNARAFIRWMWLAAGLLQGVAVYLSGSRAALAGLLMAFFVLMSRVVWARVVHLVTLVAIGAGFVLTLFPQALAATLRLMAAQTGGAGSLGREDRFIESASGRTDLWDATLSVIGKSWIVGWGPGRYQAEAKISQPAHALGLEFLASVGVVGTVLLVAIMVTSYLTPKVASPSNVVLLWISASAVALIPNMLISTHQWSLWAWLVIAMWSRAHLLGMIADNPVVEPSASMPGEVQRE